MKKTKFSHRVIAVFLTLNFLTTIIPVNYLFANNNGPNAPEASGFEPVDATDMVNLSTGDTAYVLPLIDVGGFPVTLSYHSGIPLDMESSWVGLGWNLNTGAISRGVSATPDDWSAANTLDFIFFAESENFYSINVGVGLSETAEVGVGMSWGSNKSLSGSVFGSLYGFNASISTDGNYSVGYGLGFGKDKSSTDGVGGGVSISGNLNGGKPTYGLGLGGRDGNLTGSMGFSLSDTGGSMSISGGYSNREKSSNYTGASGQSGGAGISLGSYSSGDFDISSKGFYIPIQIGVFSFGFGMQKVTYSLSKGYDQAGYGILYANQAASNDLSMNTAGILPNHRFGDYQNQYRYTDMYDQVLPQSEGEFISDSDSENMKINFSFAGYDSYEVNATGIMGSMKPKVFENATLFGLGYKGTYPNSTNGDRIKIYHHNSKGASGTGYLPTKSLGSANNFVFYFDGQFTQKTQIAPLNYTTNFSFNTNASKTMANYLPSGRAVDNNRKKSGNYVEVFTNYQIRTGQANGLMEPEGLPHASRTNAEYIDSGIGGYKITAPDGKTYHFSLPVYNYERVERTLLKNTDGKFVNEKRQYTQFATHWLLTAITGPDFVDSNNDNYPDDGDYGYWVRLDHGRWSNGYTWRSPYIGVKYNTNELGKIGDGDYGNFQFGRKDLYYLDKIVSQTHTAYFVKDIRYDATGATTGGTNSGDSFVYEYDPGFNTITNDTGTPGPDPWVKEAIIYKREYQLLLDKIVVVPNKNGTVSKSASNQNLNSQLLPGYIKNYNYTLNYEQEPNAGFYRERMASPTVYLHQEGKVYDIKDFANFDYSKAIKTIQFTYDYELATGSPSSFQCHNVVSTSNPPNINKGKLALKSVQFLGRNRAAYMPPYKFDYKGSGTSGLVYPVVDSAKNTNGEVEKAKDEWGFIDEQYYLNKYLKTTFNSKPGDSNYKSLFNQYYAQFANSHGPDNWSLNKITMPTGATINFEYEEDDYYTEAFARRYWVDNLKFRFRLLEGVYYIDIENDTPNITPEYITKDFTDYFQVGDLTFIDFSYCFRSREGLKAFHDTDEYKFLINAKELGVHSVSANQIVLQTTTSDISFYRTNPEGNPFNTNKWYSYTQGSNVNDSDKTKKGKNNCPEDASDGAFRHHSIYYKLLANKVPQDQTGGGLRVKSIVLKDENNNKYHTKYYYNQPKTDKVKNVGSYKSSGITSFAPVNGLKFIPYQSELPGAGVMYEYVTMVSESDQGEPLGETRYRFYTLQPVKDIFDPNIKMYDDQRKEIFNATVANANNHSEGLLHNDQKLYAKKINLDVNTSLVGQFRSIEEFNNEGHLLKKVEKSYLSGADLTSYNNRGYVQESFQNMKSIFKTDSDNQSPVLEKRLLSLSSRRDYTSVISSSTVTTQFGVSTESYSNADPETGAFRTTTTKMADGTLQKEDKIPAYTKYPPMGSKVTNATYKNMLTQDAMNIVSVHLNGQWKTLNANISTWNNTWSYRDALGVESSPSSEVGVWRKHKNFVWKGPINTADGTYSTGVNESNHYFNWGLGTPTNTNWQNVSEVTRYTHWSYPVEAKDINGNFAASKMADKFSKTVAGGNARYTEMYYSGAEHVLSGNNFEGEVKGASFRSSSKAHTGDYSVKNNTASDKVFEVSGTIGANQTDASKSFRPGKYKVSLWFDDSDQCGGVPVLTVNGSVKPYSEKVEAGTWSQYNYYVDLTSAMETLNLYVSSTAIGHYFDDFRMHPIYASMNSYVYDKDTDELTYILDTNNMATKYVYDPAGRLCKTYVEVMNSGSFTGGFKKVSENEYYYKGIDNPDCGDCCD